MPRTNSTLFQFIVYAIILAAIASTFRLELSSMSSIRTLRNFALKMESMAPVKSQIPLKIAVAGAGIGGMFLGFTLQSKGFDVTVFEKSSK
jgi:pyruvate/2-oxoglutarate dehydrogenase complex dihydrolipoamide dehydrogenase (E3) component